MSNTWSTLSNPDIEWLLVEDVELEPPYKVIILNDDVTTFEFVIRILQTIFGLNLMIAEQIANRTHIHGSAYVGTFPKSEAELKVNKTHFAAQLEGFPLRLTMEPEAI